MVPPAVTMCFVKYYVLLFCLLTLTHALNCRSDGGPKEAELKSIYNKCLKMQEKNSTNQRGSHDDQEGKEPRHNQRDWDRGRMGEDNRDERNRKNFSNEGMRGDNRKVGRDDGRMGGRDESRMGGRDTRMGNRERMGNDGMERDGMGGRNNMGHQDNRFGRNNNVNGREDFPQSDEFESDIPQFKDFHSTTQSSRRYKREKRIENSGQRSQYNPNTKKSGREELGGDKNSEEYNSSKDGDHKACALHCFMENLEMTGDNGMPDRYLVTHAITKDVKNEDLRDFLQESIEECFQILDNEHSEDKCEFSKNLLMCLSEKGRSNCDDWKEDLKF